MPCSVFTFRGAAQVFARRLNAAQILPIPMASLFPRPFLVVYPQGVIFRRGSSPTDPGAAFADADDARRLRDGRSRAPHSARDKDMDRAARQKVLSELLGDSATASLANVYTQAESGALIICRCWYGSSC